jgi:hypothetical protein
MLLPRSRHWTPAQKVLALSGALLAIVAFSGLVYSYERYHRGPSDSVLFGTWQCIEGCYPFYYQFTPDHNVQILDDENKSVLLKGRWYAGGDFIYVRFEQKEIELPRDILIWRIEDIKPDEFRARIWKGEPIRIYKRLDLATPRI